MVSSQITLFLQNRTHRAGAQTCLARLLRHDVIRSWNPVVVSSPGGWLVEECARIGVPVVEEAFPRSRSFGARLFGNSAFAKRVEAALATRSMCPVIVHANDHQESLLGLSIARRTGARTAIFLRSPTMTQRDYQKYDCGSYDFISAVGDDFCRRVQKWSRGKEIKLVRDGILASEIGLPKSPPSFFPRRILVVGSGLRWKGWADLTEALHLLERSGGLPPTQFDFAGGTLNQVESDLGIDRLRSMHCNFLGRVEGFRDLVLQYDLVINPSRMETFGMAAVEVLAAGVPLLSSRTGIIEQVLEQQEMLFDPGLPESLARALTHLADNWGRMDFGVARAQEHLRENFLIDYAAESVDRAYRSLLPKAQPAA